MSRPEVKICGVNSPEAADAAARHGARYAGLVFYPPSPRSVDKAQAAMLARHLPEGVLKVGLFVDPDDSLLGEILQQVPLDMIQLHGSEPPKRVAEIRSAHGRPVMKAVKVAKHEDLEQVAEYEFAADMILFDAKAPKSMTNALPGGNALSFDWRLLAGRKGRLPWMLSGGLNADNLAEAVSISQAPAVDVSSGVEDSPGKKNPDLIRAFLEKARSL
ncbi:phosphoribosylanthranilate isomerase [Fodinicurvata fenggangensis]|uniref:phosphoribosylanthranilate isomerase n=1 Tax=Fodinicurvata fenggangensis TaxID=1121830 RepID=UPI00047AD70F|nr:phosphoribosylanthranilate isomerase [Fodinicurvata fenggangensis]